MLGTGWDATTASAPTTKMSPPESPQTGRALSEAHVPPTKGFRRVTSSVNETIVKPSVAAVVGRKTILKPRLAAATNTYTSDFPDIKFRIAFGLYDNGESNPVPASGL